MVVAGAPFLLLMPLCLPDVLESLEGKALDLFSNLLKLIPFVISSFILRALKSHPYAVDPNICIYSPDSPPKSRLEHPLGDLMNKSVLACLKQDSLFLLPQTCSSLGHWVTSGWIWFLNSKVREIIFIFYITFLITGIEMLMIEKLENIEKHEKEKGKKTYPQP